MNIYLAVAALAACWCGVWASPLLPCDGVDQFVAHDTSLCIFYQCANGRAYEYACAKGSRVPSYYTKGASNPCTVKVKKNAMDVCLRCNVTDDIIPGAKNYNICAQFRPCFARGPNCTCIDQTAGSYYCSCPVAVTQSPTPANVPVPYCSVNVCKNGGTCYSLYKNQFCNCPPPYTGKLCEENVCDTTVCNNGICTYDSVGVYCQCEQCFTGACCDSVLPNCSGCSKCVGGANCTTPRTHLCECNPCPNKPDICINGIFGRSLRKCVQPPSTASDTFTLMFEDNFSTAPFGLEVYASAAADDGLTRSVTVDAPLATYTESAVILPGDVHRFRVDVSLKHTTTGKQNFGIRVRETNGNFINVYCINRATFSADGWLALPDKIAGKIFTVLSYSPIITASQFAVVAITNNTVVDIHLVAATEDIPGTGPNTIVRVNLNAWQTYQIKSAVNDLSGTIISSNNPIHVYSGEARAWVGPSSTNPDYDPNFPAASKSRDNLILECPSADTWGFTYTIVPLPRANLGYVYSEEALRIAAAVSTTCTLYTTTNANLTYTQFAISITAANNYWAQVYLNADYNYFLTCDSPVMVVEITESSIPKYGTLDDPSFIYVPAVSSYTNFYHFVPPVFSVTNGPYQYTFMRLIATAVQYPGIQVNDADLPNVDNPALKPWTPIFVPNAGSSPDYPVLFGSIFRISSNSSTAVIHPDSNAQFGCIVEGYDDRESYGVALGASLKSLRTVASAVLANSNAPVVVTV